MLECRGPKIFEIKKVYLIKMLGTIFHYLSYAIAQNSKTALQITVDSSAICI
jgi:hypothetical protein